ncbi:murein biosynthesis integral membrane protein MurJ [Thermodesulfovibrionales bacterium]|nr:murein biosynthesis integral membrane protein MurJ [Thermodesulfovibrionales bacterium]MCL0066312.1 murein biosynthesis integral membrane protein MurJ [Thermodesulfovibrionales bacterium]MCL0072077.1 murein biosynthesis integral membrane protein MurJ [Thermodesulfovibrionales bacterium]
MSAKGRITKAAGKVSIAVFTSRILGYVKDMMLASLFGATGVADVFFVAFRIPNLLRELFAEGAMSAAFIPVLTEYQTKHGHDEANRIVRATFIFIIIFVGLICVLGIVFAPLIVSVIAPGFLNEPEKFSKTVFLTRIMFPFLLFISLTALTMGALNTRRVFFISALSPAMLNITIIVCMLTLAIHFVEPIIAVAIGVTVGGLAQFLFQVPSFFRQGYTFIWPKSKTRDQKIASERDRNISSPLLWHPGLKKIGLLIVPATVGMAATQINVLISTILASYLPEGSITFLYFSMRLIQFPIGMFGVAMGMAILPTLSEHSTRREMDKLRDDFSFALRLLFFIAVPAMAGLVVLNIPIVSTLFYRGAFDYAATIATSDALMFYALGIWAIVGVKVITATFYSMQDVKTPIKIVVIAVIINILFSLLLIGPMKHNGLALANTISAGCSFMLLFYFLRNRLGSIETKKIATSLIKALFAVTVMGGAGWLIADNEIWALSGYGLQKAIYLGATIAACVGIYLFISYLLKSEEMSYILRKMKERGRK